MKFRSSNKIALGFITLVAVTYFGYEFITDQMVMKEKFEPIAPGTVNLVGISPGAGYRIITANYMAQLVQASSEFGAGSSEGGGGATEGAIKKRVPIKELLQSLQGNAEALGRFIMVMNEIREDDTWPTVRVVWRAEDLKKAFSGDATLKKKLINDLNINLDGTPLDRLNFDSMENGIIVDYPVALDVPVGNEVRSIVGRVQEPYRPRIMKAIEQRVKDKGNVTREMQAGYYRQEAEQILANPKRREIVQKSIEDMIAPDRAASRKRIPQQMLGTATVVVSDQFITGAKYVKYDGPDGKPLYNLVISLSDEGRRRLWQFSKKRVGSQILVTADGIPVAAPRISHQLSQGELTITQLQDRILVEEAVNAINESAKNKVATRS